MAFKAIIHYPASQEQMQEIHKAVAQYRAEKTVKYLTAMGVTTATLQDILHQEKMHNLCILPHEILSTHLFKNLSHVI